MRNGVSHLFALGLGLALLDADGDEFGRALAIAHDGLRQKLRHLRQRRLQGLPLGAIQTANRCITRLARSGNDERVVGGSITIHRDGVERRISHAARQLLHQCGRYGGVGRHKTQHGRHIRANHARALADAGDGDGLPANFRAQAVRLGHGVGGHDGSRGIAPVRGRSVLLSRRQGGDDALLRQRLHDHARAKGQHLRWCNAQLRRHCCAHRLGAGITVGTRARIGIARVDDEGTHRLARCQLFLANLHRCSAKTVAGEHATDARAFVQQKQGHIFAVFLAHARLYRADTQARYGVQRGRIGGAEIDGHGGLSKNKETMNSIATQAGFSA